MAQRGFTQGGAPARPLNVRHSRGKFARCVLPTFLLVDSVIFASGATKALRQRVATSPCDLMKFRAIKLLTRKTVGSRNTPVRDLISLLSPALLSPG